MKSLLLISTLASSLLLANNALADRDHRHKHRHHDHRSYQVVEYTEYARVVSSRPIYRTVAVEVPV